jgi:alkylation response protein AidB-like acyl-CoA dehydrogenase
MDFAVSEHQEMMVSAARRVAQEAIEPILRAHPVSQPLPKTAMLKVFAALAELGITAPRLPVEAGGGGLSMLDYGMILEQLPPVIALSLISHEGTIARISAGSPEEIRQAYVPDLIAGRKIACTANTEADAGSDSNAVKTRLEIEGDYAYITGRKMWITNASIADVVNVSCSTGVDENGRVQSRRVLVDRSQSDFEVRETSVTGLQQGHLSELVFERTKVPVAHVLGTAGDAGKYLTLAWNANRPLLGLMAVHLAQRSLDLARDFVGTRKQFGKMLAAHQLVQQDLADIETAVISSRLMCYYALSCMDQGMRANGTSAMAKRYATNACERAINLSMQLHGAMGISEEMGLERTWRDARMLQVPDGTTGILTMIQAREITGVGAFR